MVVMGNGKSGFDSGEGVRETATTSKESSRRANYSLPERGETITNANHFAQKALNFKTNVSKNAKRILAKFCLMNNLQHVHEDNSENEMNDVLIDRSINEAINLSRNMSIDYQRNEVFDTQNPLIIDRSNNVITDLTDFVIRNDDYDYDPFLKADFSNKILNTILQDWPEDKGSAADECPLCFEKLPLIMYTIPCGHLYCESCYNNYLLKQNDKLPFKINKNGIYCFQCYKLAEASGKLTEQEYEDMLAQKIHFVPLTKQSIFIKDIDKFKISDRGEESDD
ncbi:uncharacterized protein LOC126902587 isoform X3 [Daktulosphaira vitifoliae]|uniref:uncharacterized protein LOC126902587 isoform X3 n=1 Tax=Daktulosphaira vitifoliae TaxID=58002 RepID=UPI0021AAA78C|nr:uncharacterized protein LOC126902587 isoform X3 [Daktulosphaira vitifoliae]